MLQLHEAVRSVSTAEAEEKEILTEGNCDAKVVKIVRRFEYWSMSRPCDSRAVIHQSLDHHDDPIHS